MIPKQLTLAGIYSYQKPQTIDFETLTAGGLFGIFGATGSGKSSILEAITYALYGETERLNARDKRTYNMLNLKSDRACVDFQFYNHENKLYRARRIFKRNSKNFLEVRTPEVMFYVWKQHDWIPLEHTDAEKLIGLSYTNFKRTIIIPQGQFKEFLELSPAHRTRMLKTIFRLDRFDLQDQVAHHKKSNQSELDKIEGELSGLTTLTKENLQEKTNALRKAKQELKEVKEDHRIVRDKFQQLKQLKADFDVLSSKKKAFKKLENNKEAFKKLKENIDRYEHFRQVFYQVLVDLKKVKKERKGAIQKQKEVEEILGKLKSDCAKKNEDLEKLRPYYKQLPHKKNQADDLELIAQILAAQNKIDKEKERRQKGKEFLKKAKEEQQRVTEKIKTTEEKIDGLKAKKLDAKLLREVGEWFQRREHYEEQQRNQQRKCKAEKEAIEDLEGHLKAEGINFETIEKELETTAKKLKIQKKELLEKKEQLGVQQKLTAHAHNLKDGEACPLCGSVEHPNIVEAADVSQALNTLEEALVNGEEKEESLRKRRAEIGQKQERLRLLEERLKKEEEEAQKIGKRRKEHREAFHWRAFDPNDEKAFKASRKTSDEIEEQLETTAKSLKRYRREVEETRQKGERYREALQKIEKAEEAQHTLIESHKTRLKELTLSDYSKNSVKEIEGKCGLLREKNKNCEEAYQQLEKAVHTLQPKIAAQSQRVENFAEQIARCDADIKEWDDQIAAALQREEIDDIAEVRRVLQQDINVGEERQKIENFKVAYKALKAGKEELEEKLSAASYSSALFEQQKEKWKRAEKKLGEIRDSVATLRDNLERLRQEFKQKQALLKRLEKRQKRAENLQILFKLFKGAGFVEYISSIHLSQLCDQANTRFHRMTRHQLSLRLNDQYDFEIIDHLNEGRSRSVKTLSGGQSFQVSLSLALALAESVQTGAKADKNFFFIDEGFGTQDLESVNTIFETLLHLNRENKIVGIISHVEELKDRIPQALLVEKEKDAGSLIRMN